jgi:DNA/RNA endonuclease YhcR with UshA esterase domain
MDKSNKWIWDIANFIPKIPITLEKEDIMDDELTANESIIRDINGYNVAFTVKAKKREQSKCGDGISSPVYCDYTIMEVEVDDLDVLDLETNNSLNLDDNNGLIRVFLSEKIEQSIIEQ